MKIKLYCATYKHHTVLNECFESLSNSKIPNGIILEKYIINNHSDFQLNKKFSDVRVIHNSVRADFSTGHLARDWNCALINGFKNLVNPDCDLVVTCQNDTLFHPTWIEQLIEYNKTYCFITSGPGDGFCSYQHHAILRTGLWDERFNSIQYQEADYFIRTLNYNSPWASINDFHHKRLLNPLFKDEYDQSFVYRNYPDLEIHNSTNINSDYNFKLLTHKYGDSFLKIWDDEYIKNPPKILEKLNLLYPYFEKDVLGTSERYHLF